MRDVLDLRAIEEASERISDHVLRTPTLRRVGCNLDCELFLKAENLQPTGAFKIRGAFNLMKTLDSSVKGVVAHSSGNHAQAVARAAKVLGIPAVVVMPSDAPALKRARTAADGAEIVTVSPDSQERKETAARIARERGLIEVPPYDHPLIAAGQGTAALELLADVKSLERFYAPVSGGGLMAGCATALHALSPGTEIIGVEPEGANDTQLSLRAGERVAVPSPDTIADGLRVRTPGALTWPVVKALVQRIETVSDAEMLDAMAWAVDELRVILEPSGAASLAVALREGQGRCGVLLSGGNVDPDVLRQALSRGS
jgi:threo-3-hydroxy-L-aspartate ammonia-lyase